MLPLEFCKLFDHLPIGVIVLGVENDLQFVNQNLHHAFQFDDMTALMQEAFVLDLIKNSKLKNYVEQSAKGFSTQQHNIEWDFSETWNTNKKLAGTHYFEVDVFEQTFTDIRYIIISLNDLTPFYNDAKAIRESHLNLKTIINNTRYNIFSVDANLRFIEFNIPFKQEFDALYQWDLKIGDSAVAPPIPSQTIADWIGFYAKAMSGKKTIQEYTFAGNPYMITLNPIFDESKVVGIAVFSENLASQQQLIGELEESEFRHSFAMDVSNSGYWEWDLLTNKTYFSKIWKSMLGYQVSEIVNSYLSWENLVHPEDLPVVLDAVRKHIAGISETYITESRLLTKAGTYKWVLAKGRVVDFTADGKPKRFIGVHIDIDHIKTAEIEVKKLNKQLREIAFITSHGVRKSLANILGLTGIIDTTKFENSEHRRLIEKLISSANELNAQTVSLNEVIRKLQVDVDFSGHLMLKPHQQIIIVDDDPISNLISAKYVEKAGFVPVVFDKPMQAMQQLKEGVYNADDLILLDINMPEMDGFDFLDSMQKHKLFYRVIMLTSSINASDRERSALYSNVLDFWVKPLSLQKLKGLNVSKN